MFGKLFAPLAMKIAGGIILALLIATAFLWWRLDAKSEALRKVKAERDVAITALTAERRANEADAKRQAEREARSNQSREAMRHAEDANPEAAKAPAGRVSRAAVDRLNVR